MQLQQHWFSISKCLHQVCMFCMVDKVLYVLIM